ncbi:MAG: family N-acetyltransferase [Solirubrobacteraceae bacterium]|nr:family N-acetyltransferase [Solirubrobacteraceae bacterium]
MLLPPYRLSDGTRAVLRPIQAQDKAILAAAFARLSPESARLRFLAPKTRLTTAELRYLTEIDGADHVAIVAVLAHRPSTIVGVGRWVRSGDDPQEAEVAIVIGDPWQHQGLGRHMGLVLADMARRNGVRRFTASLLSDNVAAHRLFVRISRRLHAEHHHGVEEIVAELAA